MADFRSCVVRVPARSAKTLIPMATRRDKDYKLAARWPGNVTPKPTRPEGRGRSRGVRLSATSAWWQHEPRRRRWRGMNVAARCGCVQSQSPAARAQSPSMPKKRAVGGQRFAVGSTTTTMHRAEVLCFWPAARFDSTSRSSARQSHRGCGLGGGWDAGAVSCRPIFLSHARRCRPRLFMEGVGCGHRGPSEDP